MKMSLSLLKSIEESKIIKIYRVNTGHYIFEYAKAHYAEGTVFGTLELEHEIISDLDGNKVVGHFDVDFEHNILAYYLKKLR